MTNCVFGFPIYSDPSVSVSPTLSAGSWAASLPLTNLQDRRLAKVARSTDATAASTKFRYDLGQARPVGVLAALIPNLTKSSTPTIQWKGGTTAGASDVYNPGPVQAWPTGLTIEDVIAQDGSVLNVWITTIPATPQNARHWECAIVDTGNVDGYLDVARVIIAGALPFTNAGAGVGDGAKVGYESATLRTVLDNDAAIYQPKRRRRNDVFSINNLTYADAFASVRKMQRQLGTSGQVFWIPDRTDVTYAYERNYLGVLRELGPLEHASGRLNASFSIVEEL